MCVPTRYQTPDLAGPPLKVSLLLFFVSPSQFFVFGRVNVFLTNLRPHRDLCICVEWDSGQEGRCFPTDFSGPLCQLSTEAIDKPETIFQEVAEMTKEEKHAPWQQGHLKQEPR